MHSITRCGPNVDVKDGARFNVCINGHGKEAFRGISTQERFTEGSLVVASKVVVMS